MLVTDSIERLDQDLAGKNLAGHWRMGANTLPQTYRTSVLPHLWPWRDISEGLGRAADLVGLEESERRTVRLINPGLQSYTSQSIHASFQCVMPGEHARAHRHTMTALRFVVSGRGAYTTVDGQQCRMAPGDLILTPGWAWHDHTNDSSEPIIWMDGHDGPLVQSLHQMLFEPHRQAAQLIQTTSDENIDPAGGRRPGFGSDHALFHYRWSETERALEAVKADSPDPFEGYILRFQNPAEGLSTLTSIDCAIQLLIQGQQTQPHRHTSTTIYHVVRGAGYTTVGEARLRWEAGDTFVVPLWYSHQHTCGNHGETILFSISDAPALRALKLYREEPT